MASRYTLILILVSIVIRAESIVVGSQQESGVNHETLAQTQTQSIPSASSSPSSTGSGEWQGTIFVGQVAADDTPASHQIDPPQRHNVTIKNGTRSGKQEHEDHKQPAVAAVVARMFDAPAPANATSRILEGIYGRFSAGEDVRRERLQQMNLWLSEKDGSAAAGTRISSIASTAGADEEDDDDDDDEDVKAEPLKSGPFLLSPLLVSPVFSPSSSSASSSSASAKGSPATNGPKMAATETKKAPMTFSFDEFHSLATGEDEAAILHHNLKDSIDRIGLGEEDTDNVPDEEGNHHSGPQSPAVGTSKTPPCGSQGRFYCSYKEDYPSKVVGEVSKYYKWPLEKLFRDLRQQVMPKLANDNYGGLVCDSLTRVVRPGWARNTNNRWLVVINTDHYQQFVTEVICRNGPSAHCNFIPPCYQATCAQRYNTQKLLVIDPWNPYKGPFVSEFLFPSCCICYVPSYSPSEASGTSGNRRMDKTPYADRRTSETSTVKNEL